MENTTERMFVGVKREEKDALVGVKREEKDALPAGIEPATFRLTAECSNQLSYGSTVLGLFGMTAAKVAKYIKHILS